MGTGGADDDHDNDDSNLTSFSTYNVQGILLLIHPWCALIHLFLIAIREAGTINNLIL